MQSKYEKAVFFGDFHVPFEDASCVRIALDFNEWFKPHYVFLVGDLVDWVQLSKFDSNPERVLRLQDDINDTKDLLERIRKSAPRATIVYLCGNHENRLLKWKWKNPEVASLDALTYRELFALKDYDIQWVDYLQEYLYHDIIVEHGDIARKFSGYTAKGMHEKRGCSGVSGHSHRLGMHYHTNYSGDYVWAENGCMCSRNPEWLKRPDWQNGFTFGFFKRGQDRFDLQQQCIPDGKTVCNGREFPISR